MQPRNHPSDLLRYLFVAPAAAEGADQGDGRGEAVLADGQRRLLVAQRRLLRRDHAGPRRYRLLLVELKPLGFARRGDRPLLHRRLLFENAQARELVLDVLEAGERGLPVVGDRLVVTGARLRDHRAARAGVEHGFRERHPERPRQVRQSNSDPSAVAA